MSRFVFILIVLAVSASPVLCQPQRVPLAASSETITFKNPAAGFEAEIEGLLQYPSTPGKHPLIVFIHGSGKGTRFEYDNLFSRVS